VLVRLSRERGVPVERLRANQLVAEARAAWPGSDRDRWAKWLAEAGASLALPSREANIPLDEALQLAEDGAVLVCRPAEGDGPLMLLGFDGRNATLGRDELDAGESVAAADVAALLDAGGQGETPQKWLVFERPHVVEDHAAKHSEAHPVRRAWSLVATERDDIWVITVFAFFSGVLSLATPIAVESLVNTVAFGRFLQPVIILSILLFGSLAFAAAVKALQTLIVEILQQRLFVRLAGDLAYRLPRVQRSSLDNRYGPELVNRFLDIATVQKSVAHLLLDGIAIVLATLVGMAVLAFYHPWLLGFDLILIALEVLGLYLLGRGAIATGIDESKMKYKVTSWLQDTLRCPEAFKLQGGAAFAQDRANYLASKYIRYRKLHFRRLFRQIVFILVLQAVAGTVLLGFGGWLVINEQLTLGQLVAAEFIVAMILGSMAKLGKHLEGFYDLVASVDKLGLLMDLPMERQDGILSFPEGEALSVAFHEVRHPHGGPTLNRGLTAAVDAGERLAVYGPSGSGKSTLMDLVFGLRAPIAGRVEIEHVDPSDMRPDMLRGHVALVRGAEIFEGDLAENVHLRRVGISQQEVRESLQALGLLPELLRLPQGLETPTNASGAPLSQTQQALLMFARAMVGKPRLLLVDGALDGLPDADQQRVLAALSDVDRPWTLIVTTGRRSLASQLDRTIQLEGSPSFDPRSMLGSSRRLK